jgi:hypothetical protein
LIYRNFNFDFLDLHNVFFENYFVNELARSIVFDAIWNIRSACVVSDKTLLLLF